MFRSRCGVAVLLVCLFILSIGQSHAQETSQKIESRLAGTRGRDWIFKTIENFMGPGNRCKQGESYRFNANHTVVISQCISGTMHTQTLNWSIESIDPLETHIKVGPSSYILRFWDSADGHFMALRSKATSKTETTQDKKFQLAEE